MRWLLVSLLLILSAQQVAADKGLVGLKEISISIRGIDKDAEACGIKQETLETSLNLPINAYTKLIELPRSPSLTTLILDVLVLDARSYCATNVELRVVHYMPVVLAHQADAYVANITLYRHKQILVHPHNDRISVSSAVEGLAKTFAHSWQKQNPN